MRCNRRIFLQASSAMAVSSCATGRLCGGPSLSMSDEPFVRAETDWLADCRFGSPYSLDPRGPHNSVSTKMAGFQFPWEQFTVAAEAGHSNRLVTYNAGVSETFLYRTHQDYWAGELVNLDTPPQDRYLTSGLQWFGWICLDDRAWVHAALGTPIPPPLYSDEQVIRFIQTCRRRRAPVTFNVGIYQDGMLAEASVEQLHRLHRAFD